MFGKIVKRIGIGLLAVLLLGGIGFFIWAETPLGPEPEALQALSSDEKVNVEMGDIIVFAPAGKAPATGFIFYPGGRVDARSYAAPLRRIAEHGYLVVLVPVRLNLAFFDIEAAANVFDQFPGVKHWVAGGHSLGGVASALFAQAHPEVEGLIFWASYPADNALADSDLKMLSIYGTEDMAGMGKFDETRPFLVPDAQIVVIDGGNHAQFGDYGIQPGDNPALISRQEQQALTVDAVTAFLSQFER